MSETLRKQNLSSNGETFSEHRSAANDDAVSICVTEFDDNELLRDARRLPARYTLALFGAGISRLRRAGGTLVHQIRRLWDAYCEGVEEAQAIRELEAFDERLLQDIGIEHRSRIASVVREMRATRRYATSASDNIDRTMAARREAQQDRAVRRAA